MSPQDDTTEEKTGTEAERGGTTRRRRKAARTRPARGSRRRSVESDEVAPESAAGAPPLDSAGIEAKRDWLRRKFH